MLNINDEKWREGSNESNDVTKYVCLSYVVK